MNEDETMLLPFEKWHGCRNDFVIVWLTADNGIVRDSLKRQAPRLCDRQSGIGADGLLVLDLANSSELLPKKLTIINSDGSLAQHCGNGVRCAASSVLRRFREKKAGSREELEHVELALEDRVVTARFLGRKSAASVTHWPLVSVEMGVPAVDDRVSWKQDARAEITRVAKEVGLASLPEEANLCDIGNRHLVFFRDDSDVALLRRIGPAFQSSMHWDGINIHLVASAEVSSKDQASASNLLGAKITDLYRAFVWERGAGETPACGTGACAIAAAAMHSGNASRSDWVAIDMPGGRLYVKQEAENDPMILAGPADFVFSGTIEI